MKRLPDTAKRIENLIDLLLGVGCHIACAKQRLSRGNGGRNGDIGINPRIEQRPALLTNGRWQR